MTTLVRALSQKYPQSVYYTMRAFLLERREHPDRGGGSGASDSNKLAKATTVRLPAGGTVRLCGECKAPVLQPACAVHCRYSCK